MGGKAPLTEQFSSRSHQKKEKRDIRMDIERPVGNLLRLTRLPPRKRRSNVSTSHPEEQSSREQFDSLHRSPTKQKTPPRLVVFFVGDPWENRTPVSALRGPCLSRLTNGPSRDCYDIILQNSKKVNTFLKSFSDFFALYQNCIFLQLFTSFDCQSRQS